MAIDYWADLVEENVYHIYNRSVGDLKIFREDADYNKFLVGWEKYFSSYCDTFAYCLIPNHFHFLVKVKNTNSILQAMNKEQTKAASQCLNNEEGINFFLEDQMRRFFSSYALSFNHKYSRHGTVFSDKVKRVLATSDSKVLYWLCYIHHNPIHHKLCTNYSDWKYSSYDGCFKKKSLLIVKNEMLNFIDDLKRLEDFHREFKKDFQATKDL